MTGYIILFSVILAASAGVIFSGVFDGRFTWIGLPARVTRKGSACWSQFAEWIDRLRSLIIRLQSQIVNYRSRITDEDLSFSMVEEGYHNFFSI